jgi:hypothetical protein
MRKFLPLLVVGVLVLSGLGAVALNVEKESNKKSIVTENLGGPRDYTHTVLVEAGMRTGCPACPATNAAWKSIYASGNYDFEYVGLIYEYNTKAYQRFLSFNPKYVPTSYFDGGQYVCVGTNYNTFYNYLNSAGSRTVPDLEATISASWLGDAKIEISLSIKNNDINDYPGTLRVYVVELVSPRWNDYNGQPYGHALLDFPWQQTININSGDTFEDSKVWDGAAAGYSDIDPENIQVILAVFDDTPHQSYSDPPSGNPFWAYYSDECIATLIEESPNNPPEKPTIDGPTSGKPGTAYTYTFCTTDPDGDDVSYYVDWGDGTTTDWTTPSASGVNVTVSHKWTKKGTYTIKAKAKDIYGAESDWTTLSMSIPRTISINVFLQRFFERFPHAFPILRRLLGL